MHKNVVTQFLVQLVALHVSPRFDQVEYEALGPPLLKTVLQPLHVSWPLSTNSGTLQILDNALKSSNIYSIKRYRTEIRVPRLQLLGNETAEELAVCIEHLVRHCVWVWKMGHRGGPNHWRHMGLLEILNRSDPFLRLSFYQLAKEH